MSRAVPLLIPSLGGDTPNSCGALRRIDGVDAIDQQTARERSPEDLPHRDHIRYVTPLGPITAR
jgi:hypothetical protein